MKVIGRGEVKRDEVVVWTDEVDFYEIERDVTGVGGVTG